MAKVLGRDYGLATLGDSAAWSDGIGRPTEATLKDWEGRVITALDGEARFEGGRRVDNMGPPSEDFTDAAWTKLSATLTPGVADPFGGNNATIFTADAGGAYIYFSDPGNVVGQRSEFAGNSVYVRRRTGTGTITFRDPQNLDVNITASVTSSWNRVFASSLTPTAHRWLIQLGTAGDEIDIIGAQLESLDGSNTNPGEYVSVGVESSPFHGALVDGVQYFNHTNPNTVTNYIVDPNGAVPVDFDPPPYLLLEPSSINLFLNSDAPVTQTVTLTGGNEYTFQIVSYDATGSMALSGGVTDTVTDGSPVTANVTGDVTCTISGNCDFAQVEADTQATSIIITAGASVQRDSDLAVAYPLTTPQTEGMAVVEATIPQFVTSAVLGLGFAENPNDGPLTRAVSGNLKASDETNSSQIAPIEQPEYVAARWGADMQIGYYSSGTWKWATPSAYDGNFPTDGQAVLNYLPQTRGEVDLFDIYDTDEGTQWIEDNYPPPAGTNIVADTANIVITTGDAIIGYNPFVNIIADTANIVITSGDAIVTHNPAIAVIAGTANIVLTSGDAIVSVGGAKLFATDGNPVQFTILSGGTVVVDEDTVTVNAWQQERGNLAAADPTPAVISAHPANDSVVAPAPASFSVTAINAASYQWYVDDVPQIGETLSTFTINPTSAGTYSITCIVLNAASVGIRSNAATLTVT